MLANTEKMNARRESLRPMTQAEINEQFIMTLDYEYSLYYKTILAESQWTFGLKTGGEKERDLKYVKNRYDAIDK